MSNGFLGDTGLKMLGPIPSPGSSDFAAEQGPFNGSDIPDAPSATGGGVIPTTVQRFSVPDAPTGQSSFTPMSIPGSGMPRVTGVK